MKIDFRVVSKRTILCETIKVSGLISNLLKEISLGISNLCQTANEILKLPPYISE